MPGVGFLRLLQNAAKKIRVDIANIEFEHSDFPLRACSKVASLLSLIFPKKVIGCVQ